MYLINRYMMCLNKEDLYERAVWDGAAGTSRRQLLEKLQGVSSVSSRDATPSLISVFIPPKVMVPSRRLATLLDQARRLQRQDCVFHDDGNASSLYLDHECSSGQFPGMTTHILADHTDEVWKLEWSPDGTMLASAGKDHMVVIWQLKVCQCP
jgi:WD40 repeat protein